MFSPFDTSRCAQHKNVLVGEGRAVSLEPTRLEFSPAVCYLDFIVSEL